MNQRRTVKEILGRNKWSRDEAIRTLRESEADIWILPEPYESNEGDWYQPDLAIVRNRESILEDLERGASHCFVKFYLGVFGRRVGNGLHEQYCLPSNLFIDWKLFVQLKKGIKREGKERKLIVNYDCSYVQVNGKGFTLDGVARETILLFTKYWHKGIRELASADILRELNQDQTLHFPKLFRGQINNEIYNLLIRQTRHGHYSFSASEIENLEDHPTLSPNLVQTMSTSN